MDLSESRHLHPAASYSPHPLMPGVERVVIYDNPRAGETIVEYLERTGLAARIGRRPVRVTINGWRVPREIWKTCRPKPGTTVHIQAEVRGGGGGSGKVLRSVAFIVLAYLSYGTSAYLQGAGYGAATAGAAGAAVLVAGSLAVNALFPLPKPQLPSGAAGDSPTYALSGGSNRARPYEPMPAIMGTRRVFPDLGAKPYVEFREGEQFLFQVFDFGYNDVELSDLKIGDTPIESFTGVVVEVSDIADGKLSLFPGNVDSLEGGTLDPFVYVTRTSSPDATALAVEIDGLLFWAQQDGTMAPIGVGIDIQYRAVGTTTWTQVQVADDSVAPFLHPESYPTFNIWGFTFTPGVSPQAKQRYFETVNAGIPGQITLINSDRKPIRRFFRWEVPQGQYEVKVARVTSDADEQNRPDAVVRQIVWTQLKSYQVDTGDYTGRKRVAVSIRASGQLTGSIDQFNATARAKALAYVPLNSVSKTYESNLWAAGTAAPSGYSLNQDVAGESTFALRTGPFATSEVVNVCQSKDTPFGDPGADGGWTMANLISIDKTKPYLFACFFKRLSTGTITSASAYWGLNTDSASDVLDLGGGANTNPYFVADGVSAFMPNADQWYLAVGFVHENGYGTTDTNISGVYDLNGVRVHGGSEYKWPADATLCGHRAYHYYNMTISGEVQQMARPVVIPCTVAQAPSLITSILSDRRDYTLPDWSYRQTSNPASWMLAATRGRYLNARRVWGAGLPDSRIDIPSVQAFATWCDAQGVTFNHIFDQPISADDMLAAIALRGRGTKSWGSGKLGVVWDAPDQPVVAVFSMANVVAGSFSIQYATEQLADELVVSFDNPDLGYRRDVVRVLAPGVTNPSITRTLDTVGCTNKVEAAQDANLYISANVFRSRTYVWQMDFEGMPLSKGEVGALAQDLASFDYSGRLGEGCTASVLQLDRAIVLPVTGGFVTVVKPDGTQVTKSVTPGTGAEVTSLTLTSALAFDPSADANHPPYDYKFLFGLASSPGRKVKIAAVRPLSEQLVELTALDETPEYYLSKTNPYAYTPPKPLFGGAPQITELALTEEGVRAGTGYVVKVTATWKVSGDYGGADVRASVNSGSWLPLSFNARVTTAEIVVQDGSTVVFEVMARNSLNLVSNDTLSKASVTKVIDFAGIANPSDVTGFTLDGDTFRWDEVPDVDVVGYIIRFHYGENRSFSDAQFLHDGLLTYSPKAFGSALPAGVCTFFVTALDAAGLESEVPGVVVKDLGDVLTSNIVEDINFRALSWPGNVTGGSNVGGDLEATSANAFYGDDDGPFYADDAADFYETETFLEMVYIADTFYPDSAWVGSPMYVLSTTEGQAVTIEYRTTNSDPFYGADADDFYGADADPFYGAEIGWRPWIGALTAEARDYQLRVTTSASAVQGAVRALDIIVDVPDSDEFMQDVVIGIGGTRLPITKPWAAIKNVQLTLQSSGTAVSTLILDRDATLGPLVEAIDASRASVAGLANAHVRGYLKAA